MPGSDPPASEVAQSVSQWEFVKLGGGIANYCSLSLFSLGLLDKLQGKVMTPTEKVEWWNILMVDRCQPFSLFNIE